MAKVIERYANSQFVAGCRRVFSSVLFPIVSSAVLLATYYLGFDLLCYWYIGICGSLILLTCKDVLPFVFLLMIIGLPISYINSPSIFNPVPSDYYFLKINVAQLIFIGATLVSLAVARIIYSIAAHRFKVHPILFGLCALGAALMLNGLLSTGYTLLNLMYGCAVMGLYLGIFMFLCGNIILDGETFKKLAFYFILLFLILAIELVVGYVTCEGFIVNGKIAERDKLFFGWGTYNNMAVLIVMCIPAWFYFAGTRKYGWAYLSGGTVNLLFCYLTNSRQGILMGTVVYAACCVWNIVAVKGKRRALHAGIIAAVFALLALVLIINRNSLIDFWNRLKDGTETGSGRLELWKEGITNFLRRPIFGVGFFGGELSEWDAGGSGLSKIPRFYHNTVVEMLGACGIVGAAAFALHRVQTVISLIKNFSYERIFLALTMCGVMLCGLLDVHMFSPFSALMYTSLVPILAISERKEGADGKVKLKTLNGATA